MKKLTINNFIEKAKFIHGNRYNYFKVNYINSRTKIIISCNKHGCFTQIPNSHLNGSGCKKCFDEEKSLTYLEFIKKSKKIHNGKYDYSESNYINNYTKIKIICKIHGVFFQTPQCHLDGQGCSKCKSSKGELKIIHFLNENGIKYIAQKSFNDCKNLKTGYKLKYDFYIPSKNLLIEYDGEQHFKYGGNVGKYKITKSDLEYTKYKDKIKTKYAKRKGIRLLRICYKDFNKIGKIIHHEK